MREGGIFLSPVEQRGSLLRPERLEQVNTNERGRRQQSQERPPPEVKDPSLLRLISLSPFLAHSPPQGIRNKGKKETEICTGIIRVEEDTTTQRGPHSIINSLLCTTYTSHNKIECYEVGLTSSRHQASYRAQYLYLV